MLTAFRCGTIARLILALMVAIVPLIIWNATPTSVEIKVLVINICVPLALLFLLVDFLFSARVVSLPRLPSIAAILMLLYSGVVTALRPYGDFRSYSQLIIGVSVFLLTAALFSGKKKIEALLTVWLCASLPVSAYFLLQRAGIDFLEWGNTLLIPQGSTFTNRNHLLFYLVCTWPFAGYMAMTPGALWRRIIAASSFALIIAAIIVSNGRGAWAITAIGVPFILLFLRGRIQPKPIRSMLLTASATLFAATAAAIIWGAFHVSRLEYWDKSELTHGRTGAWQAALRMADVHPVFGHGVGSLPKLLPEFEDYRLAVTLSPMQPLIHCHSEYLELLAECGAVGLLLFLALIALVLRHAARENRNSPHGSGLFWASIIASGNLLLFLFFAVEQRYLYCAIFFWVTLALTLNSSMKDAHETVVGIAVRRGIAAVLVAYVCAAAWFCNWAVRDFVSNVYVKKALEISHRPALRPVALRYLQQAARLMPDNIAARYQLGYVYTIAGEPDSALRQYSVVQKNNPHFQNVHFNRGMIFYGKRDFSQARRELEFTARQYPSYEPGLLHLAESCYYTGELEKCRYYLKWLLIHNPGHPRGIYLKKFIEGKILEEQARNTNSSQPKQTDTHHQ